MLGPGSKYTVHTVGSIPEPEMPPSGTLSKDEYNELYNRLMGQTSTENADVSSSDHPTRLSPSLSAHVQQTLTGSQPQTLLAPGDQARGARSLVPTEVRGFPLPSHFRTSVIGTNSPAPSIQPGFRDRFDSVVSAIEAWPNRLPLLNKRDPCFVEDCASADGPASLWNNKETYHAATVTYLVNEYGAELWAAISKNPNYAHVCLLPNLARHVRPVRDDHDTRSKVEGCDTEEVIQETINTCVEIVRDELKAACSAGAL